MRSILRARTQAGAGLRHGRHAPMPTLAVRWRRAAGKTLFLLALLLAVAERAQSSGLSNSIQSATANANATAGQTAAAEDASTIFYNPAGMAMLGRNEIVNAVGIVFPSTSFGNHGSTDAVGGLMTGSSATNPQTFALPSLFAASQINDTVHIGLGVFSPDGQATKYADNWVGRYQLQHVALKTIDVDPAIGVRLSNELSIGAGLDIQYAHLARANAIDFGSLCFGVLGPISCTGLGLMPQRADGRLNLDLSSWAVGYNLGILFTPSDATHIGLSYRSPVDHGFSGSARFNVPATAAPLTASSLFRNTSARSQLSTPDVIAFGLSQRIAERWTALIDVDWTVASRVKQLALTFDNPTQPRLRQPLNWHDTIRVAIGLVCDLSPETKLRAGIAYDQSPIPSAFRSADLPSSDKVLIGVGVTQRVRDSLWLTTSYSREQYAPASMHIAVPGAGTLIGRVRQHSDAVGLQARLVF
jgi:long-chain fatty acid transport protein